jgi:acetate---CoA ligase (ADP-forming)
MISAGDRAQTSTSEHDPGPSPEVLRGLLTARNIALVGASNSSRWSLTAFTTATRYNFPGNLYLVNRRGEEAHGRPTATSCQAIGEPIDMAILLVGARGLPDALRDAAAAGARGAIVLASGFGETGATGLKEQASLVELARDLGISFLGPNCLGFVNFVDQVCGWASPAPVPLTTPGDIALVSQSGGTAMVVGRFAAKMGVSFSHVISTGNEAMINTLDVARVVIDDERVSALAMFVETIADAGKFDDLATRAAELEKPIVMMKVGRSDLAAEVIASHTGVLAGDDALIDVALRSAGVLRVDSLEELIVTTRLASRIGRRKPGKLAVVSISGGACDIVVDVAEANGIPLAPLKEETKERLRETGSSYGAVRNPLDVTGAAVGGPQLMVDAVNAVAADPDVGLVAIVDGLPDGEHLPHPSERLVAVGSAIRHIDTPCILLHSVTQYLPPGTREELEEIGISHWVTGLDIGLRAIGHVMRWWAWQTSTPEASPLTLTGNTHPETEVEALDLLRNHGIPVVPHQFADNPSDAVVIAADLGYPVAVKIVSPQILHKSDVGGVVLNVRDEGGVRHAYDQVTSAGSSIDGAQIDGVMLSAMRSGGIELVVGVVCDPTWGPVVAVGLGGIWVNVLNDSSLRRLPVHVATVREMISELRGRSLFEGFRGTQPVDVDALSRVIVDFSRLAIALGSELSSIEINPLRVDGHDFEALDAAVTWN